MTWRKPSGAVTLDGVSGWQKRGWWKELLGLLACRRSLCHLREYSVAHLLAEPKQSRLLPGPVCARPKTLRHVGGGGTGLTMYLRENAVGKPQAGVHWTGVGFSNPNTTMR